jgi:hypothetical protein
MNHLSDDDLVLHYYGEDERPRAHLLACAECASRYHALTAVLQAVAPVDVPERGDQYGLEVWQRIRHRLPVRAAWWHGLWSWQGAAAMACGIALIVVGFTAGRFSTSTPAGEVAVAPRPASDDEQVRRRVLFLTVADHLDQTDRVLTDVVNAPGGLDISGEQAWAVDLVANSRLYRQEAIETNETSLAAVLDELERTLLEIVHRPSRVTDADVAEIRRRIDSAALLFKVRVMSTELRELTDQPAHPSFRTTQPTGSAL